jgi:hypothetical protein
MHHLAKRDIELADEKLYFDLSNYKPGELVDNAEENIKMGYDETIKLFK